MNIRIPDIIVKYLAAKFWVITIPLVALFCLSTIAGYSQDNPRVIRCNENLFPRIELLVAGIGETSGGIVLTENDKQQNITKDCEEGPLSAVFIIDRTLPMSYIPGTPFSDKDSIVWKSTKSAVLEFINRMQHDDETAIIGVANSIRILSHLNNDKKELLSIVQAISLTGGRFTLTGSLAKAYQILHDKPNPTAVIIITEGGYSLIENSMTRLVMDVQRYDVPTYALSIKGVANDIYIDSLSKMSGGFGCFRLNPAAWKLDLTRIKADLLSRCYVNYESTNACPDGSLRNVKLEFPYDSSLDHVKASYYAPYIQKSLNINAVTNEIVAPGGDIYLALYGRGSNNHSNAYFEIHITYPSDTLHFSEVVNAENSIEYSVENDTLRLHVKMTIDSAVNRYIGSVVFTAAKLHSAKSVDIEIDKVVLNTPCAWLANVPIHATILVDGICNKLVRKKSDVEVLSFYPHPVTNQMNVVLKSSKSGNTRIIITDLRGRMIYDLGVTRLSGGIETFSYTFPPIEDGLYLLILECERRTVVRSFMVVSEVH